jgi:hypothetical protein
VKASGKLLFINTSVKSQAPHVGMSAVDSVICGKKKWRNDSAGKVPIIHDIKTRLRAMQFDL